MNNPLYVSYQTEGQKLNQATKLDYIIYSSSVIEVRNRNRLAVTESSKQWEDPVWQLLFQNKAEPDADDGRTDVDSAWTHRHAAHES